MATTKNYPDIRAGEVYTRISDGTPVMALNPRPGLAFWAKTAKGEAVELHPAAVRTATAEDRNVWVRDCG